jgi:hypothetical protein
VATTSFMRVAHGRLALVMWSFIALALMVPACTERANNSDTGSPVVVTGNGVEIMNVERDETRRTVVATVSQHGIQRSLTLAPLPDGPSPGFTAILDDNGSFYEMSIAVNEHTAEVWIRERTAVDEMTMTIRQADGRVFESYEINGERMAFERPDLPFVQMEKALARTRAGTIHTAATPELRETGEVLAAFDAFYAPTLSNTLNNNPAGELLMSLLEDDVMTGVVVGDDPAPDRKDGLAQRGCFVATRCAAVACLIGGSSNPICAACAGAATACAIVEIYCWFAGCDCCF